MLLLVIILVAFVVMSVASAVIGLGTGTVGAAFNNYIAQHYKASHMNFLHCFYGIGITASSSILAIALSHGEISISQK